MKTSYIANSQPAIALLIVSSLLFAQPSPAVRADSVAAPSTSATTFTDTIGPEKGTLVIVGGGKVGPEIWKKFVELAGGANAKIVFIPTAEEDNEIPNDPIPETLKSSYGAGQVTVLHTRDPKVADTDAFVAPLKDATGVWFGGGRQWHIADSYLNTLTEKELYGVLDRGGVIGGWSAGASIQGSYLVRGDTSSSNIVDGDHKVGFGFLKESAIDQHILRRNREFDLIPLISAHPDLLGIGIDESTAIVVHGSQFQVIGASYVAITDARIWSPTDGASDTARTSPNDAARKGKLYFLQPGQVFDTVKRRIVAQGNAGGYQAESSQGQAAIGN